MKQAIKNISVLLVLCLTMMLATGCVSVALSGQNSNGKSVTGKGEVISRKYEASGFSSININVNLNVILHSGSSDNVEFSGQENLAELLEVTVKNEVLVVKSKYSFNYTNSKPAEIHIYVPDIENIELNGFINLDCADTISGSDVNLLLSGTSTIDLDLNCATLKTDIDGLITMTLKGAAKSADYSINGTANINALAFETQNSVLNMDGMGNIKVNASETLSVSIDGSGTVEYTGSPVLSQNINGLGGVKQISA